MPSASPGDDRWARAIFLRRSRSASEATRHRPGHPSHVHWTSVSLPLSRLAKVGGGASQAPPIGPRLVSEVP